MTIVMDAGTAVPAAPLGARPDRRGSWIPSGGMITTRIMELRKRRSIMIALVVVRHWHPQPVPDHPPAQSRHRPPFLRAGGRLRHLHQPGGRRHVRLRLHRRRHPGRHRRFRRSQRGDVPPPGGDGAPRACALYLARIPAGMAIVVPLVAAGFTIVCAVCVLAAPTPDQFNSVQRARPLDPGRLGKLGRRPSGPGSLQRLRPGGAGGTGESRRALVLQRQAWNRPSTAVATRQPGGAPARGRRPTERGANARRSVHHRRDRLRPVPHPVPLSVGLAHDQERAVAGTGSAHRLQYRGPRTGVAAGPGER